MSAPGSGLMMLGCVIALGGAVALAIPVFSTMKTDEVARVGDLKLTVKEETRHSIPPIAAGGALALGLALVGAGFVRRT
jgi:hypothetical protein